MKPDYGQLADPSQAPEPPRRRVPWHVSLLGLVILVPVGWTVWLALGFVWHVDSIGLGLFAGAYVVLGVFLMVRRIVGVWRERRTGAITSP